MPKKSADDSLSCINWIYHNKKAWVEFTTLTEEERINLKNRAIYFKKWKQKQGLLT